jgi:AAA family ATP:ADP antiporter
MLLLRKKKYKIFQVKRLILRLFNIHEGEGFKASLMFFYGFLLIASFLILKPAVNSLFLEKFGAGKLPHVFVLVALFSVIIAWIYSRYSKKIRLNLMIIATILVSIACLLIFWLLLYSGHQLGWILYAFYIFVEIFGVITGAQFWLLANYIYNAREAKRLFGFIGAGAICGGVFGGILTNRIAEKVKTENLIFFCIGFLFICIFLLRSVWKSTPRHRLSEIKTRRKKPAEHDTSDNPVKLILKSKHLIYLTGILGVGVVVANIVDYQFSAVASSIITETDKLTSFFGFWMSTLNIISLAIQLFLTTRIMKYFGVAASLFFLPVGLFLGAAVIFFSPALWSAILIKISDGGMKHSINKAGTELLALPIPTEVKNKAKTFIDIFIKNIAKGLGGILLIALTAGLGFSIRLISLVVIALVALWIFMIFRVKKEYVNSFRQAIEKRSINIEQQALNLEDAAVFKSFLIILEGKSDRQILYVLNLLEDVKNKELAPHLKNLISHPSNEIKACVLKIARKYEEVDLLSEAKTLITNESREVRIQAVQYLCKVSSDKAQSLKELLENNDFRINAAAMICSSIEWAGSEDFRELIDIKDVIAGMLRKIEKKSSEEQKIQINTSAAWAIGKTKDPELFPYLHQLINSSSPEVKKAAILSIGLISQEEFIPPLIAHLNAKHVRKYARESLAMYGEDIIDALSVLLENKNEEKRKRTAIPKVFALIGSQKSVNILTENLSSTPLALRSEIIKALNKIKENFPHLKFDKSTLKTKVLEEIDGYFKTLALWLCQNITVINQKNEGIPGDDPKELNKRRSLFISALGEKLKKSLERIFRLLALVHSQKDMTNAFLGATSDKPNLKANALEFLDNILEADLKRLFIPMIEISKSEALKNPEQKFPGLKIPSETESIDIILESDDFWLQTCVLYLVAGQKQKKFIPTITTLGHSPDPMVRETVKYCLIQLDN